MSFADFQERLSRSIKVVGLPSNYEQQDILENLKNAGTIEDIKLGPNEMIVTYSNSNEKDLSKMYDGCPIGEYVLKLEDPTSFELIGGDAPAVEEKPEPKQPEPEVPAYTHYEPQVHQTHEVHHHEEPAHHVHHQEPEKVQEIATEPVRETVVEPIHEPVAEIVHHHVEPVVEHHVEPAVQHHEPVVHHVEPVHHHEPEPAVVHHVEPVHQHTEAPRHHEPEPVYVAPVQEKVQEPAPVVVEKKVEPQPERRTETVHTEKRVEATPAPAVVERKQETSAAATHHVVRGGESSKDLLRELQNTNLPARAGLPNDDLFNVVTKRSYLLIFTMIWALQLFLRSVF